MDKNNNGGNVVSNKRIGEIIVEVKKKIGDSDYITDEEIMDIIGTPEKENFDAEFQVIYSYLEKEGISIRIEPERKRVRDFEYEPTDESYDILEERKNELIQKVVNLVGSGKSISQHEIFRIIGDVKPRGEEAFQKELQFLYEYLQEQNIEIHSISQEMDEVNYELGQETAKRVSGPGKQNARTAKQKRILLEKRHQMREKNRELREKRKKYAENKLRLKELGEDSEESRGLKEQNKALEGEIKELEQSTKELDKEISKYSDNLPIYEERKNELLFREHAKIREKIAALQELIDNARLDDEYFDEDSEESLANVQELEEQLADLIEESLQIRNRIAENNLRLVKHVIYQQNRPELMHLPQNYTYEEREQEGYLGLLKAIDSFDYTKGFKFSTFASPEIASAVARTAVVKDKDNGFTRGALEIPAHQYGQVRKYRKIEGKLTKSLGREPTAQEIADEFETTIDNIKEISQLANQIEATEPIDVAESTMNRRVKGGIGPKNPRTGQREHVESINAGEGAIINDEGEREWLPIIEGSPTPENIADFREFQDKLRGVLDGLAERERKVIEIRFGLMDGHPKTLEEAGRELGVTRERIRQIESKTLAKLRHPSRSSKLKDYLEDDFNFSTGMDVSFPEHKDSATEEKFEAKPKDNAKVDIKEISDVVDPNKTPTFSQEASDIIDEMNELIEEIEGTDEAIEIVDEELKQEKEALAKKRAEFRKKYGDNAKDISDDA